MSSEYDSTIQMADELITKYGQPLPATLRRNEINDRPCTAVMIDYRPNEKGLRLEGARRFLISTIDPVTGQTLTDPPNHELDQIVFGGMVYNFPTPDSGPRLSGVTLFHDMEGVYVSSDIVT